MGCMTPIVLAIDLGSTRFKASAFDSSLRRVGFGAGELRYCFGEQGRVELGHDDIVQALVMAVKEALQGVAAGDLKAIALTSQAQTFTVMDAVGQVKMPFISWQDTRAEAASVTLSREVGLNEFAEHSSFGTILPGLQITQLRHMAETRPGWLQSRDRIALLPAYITWLLTDALAVDANLAAMSGLYSLKRNDWWDAALDAVKVNRGQLPVVVPLGSVAARTGAGASRVGLTEGVPLVLAGNDQTAGAYGAELEPDGGVLVTLGTAQVAYTVAAGLGKPASRLIRGPYPGGRYYRMAADSCGGSIINWAQTVLAGCGDDTAFFTRAAEAGAGCGGLRFHAELSVAGGSWSGIGLQHRPADFARSILECLSARMAGMLELVEEQPGRGMIKVAGGGSEQLLWRRILEEALGRSLRKTQASPLEGAARMAWETLGARS